LRKTGRTFPDHFNVLFSTKHAALNSQAKTGWLGIRIMCDMCTRGLFRPVPTVRSNQESPSHPKSKVMSSKEVKSKVKPSQVKIQA
jgi:hypothetical protein